MNDYSNTNKEAYNLVAINYKEEHSVTLEWEQELKKFASYLNFESPEIVDLGCGPGQETIWLKWNIKGAKVTGIDFSEQMIAVAQDSLPDVNFVCADIATYVHPVSVNAIWARASLHHLTEQSLDECFESINHYIHSEGLIGVVNKVGEGEETEEKNKYGHVLRRYFNFFNEERVRNIANKYGYSVLEQYERQEGGHAWLISFLKKRKRGL